MQILKRLFGDLKVTNLERENRDLKQQLKAEHILIKKLEKDLNNSKLYYNNACKVIEQQEILIGVQNSEILANQIEIKELKDKLNAVTKKYEYQKNQAVPLWKSKYYKLKKQNA